MGYTTDENMVKVEFFKKTGKWYTTEAIRWDRYYSVINGEFEDIKETFKRCLRQQLGDRLSGMIAVCIHPYHEYAHPLMVHNWDKYESEINIQLL